MEEKKKSGLSIFIYLIPVYILAAVPLVQWTMKNFSNDVELTKEEQSAFNSDEGEIRKTAPAAQAPDLVDGALNVRYRSGGSKGGTQEEMNLGYTQGQLSDFVTGNAGDPKAVAEMFSNRWVVKGFLSRPGVKKALTSKEALLAALAGGEAEAFVNSPAAKAALASPALLDALAGSFMTDTLLGMTAAQQLMADPDAVQEALDASPRLAALLRRPDIKAAVSSNPKTAGLKKSLGWR